MCQADRIGAWGAATSVGWSNAAEVQNCSLNLGQFALVVLAVDPLGVDLEKHLQAVAQLARHEGRIHAGHGSVLPDLNVRLSSHAPSAPIGTW